MNVTLQILGTASAMPISDKNPSAQVLTVHGRLFLIDCGEGTQKRMRQTHLSFLKVEAIFISHIHGDHVFGLFGVLSTMAMYNRTQVLHIYGPEALGSIIKFYRAYYGAGMNYEIEFHKISARGLEEVHLSKNITVSAFPLKHGIECYGYRFGDKYAYCSDTAPFEELASYVRGVEALYHEATYPKEYGLKAAQRFHSTTIDAARCAREAGVGRLLIGHYSSRFRDHGIFQDECREIFENTLATDDGDVYEIK